MPTEFNDPQEYLVSLDVRNMLESTVTIKWRQRKRFKEIDMKPGSQNTILIRIVEKFYPDPISVTAINKNTTENIKLRGREDLRVTLRKKEFTEIINIGKCIFSRKGTHLSSIHHLKVFTAGSCYNISQMNYIFCPSDKQY